MKKNGWHDPNKGDLPKEGQYVIGYFKYKPWFDEDSDPKYKIVRLEKGISLEERENLPECERKYTFYGKDEGDNNLRPYRWKEFGPGDFFGQECVAWHEIPKFEGEYLNKIGKILKQEKTK